MFARDKVVKRHVRKQANRHSGMEIRIHRDGLTQMRAGVCNDCAFILKYEQTGQTPFSWIG